MTSPWGIAAGAARGRASSLLQALPATRRRLGLEGRTALVTGAGAGIGAAVAADLHARGATVGVLDRDAATAEAVATALGERAVALEADVRDRERTAATVAELERATGRLDVVVANAGIAPRPGTIAGGDPDEFDRVLAVNQTGAYNAIRPALRSVVAHRGHVVVVSSVAAFVPGVGGAAYMVSKAGVEALGRALRLELAPHGATVGIAYFGIVETAMTRITLDDDPVGREAEQLLPAPLRRRIPAAEAARVLVDGIDRRAPSTMAPAAWRAWSLGRGVAQVLLDDALARDPHSHRLVRGLDDGDR